MKQSALMRQAFRAAAIVLLLIPAVCGHFPVAAAAEDTTEKPKKDPWTLKMFRFEFYNDSFIGSDDEVTWL